MRYESEEVETTRERMARYNRLIMPYRLRYEAVTGDNGLSIPKEDVKENMDMFKPSDDAKIEKLRKRLLETL